jgi:hypothetical protein
MPLPIAPTCPLCGAALPLSKAWWGAFGYRALIPWRDFGVRCERCGAPLFVLKNRAMAFSIGLIALTAAISGLVLVWFADTLLQRMDDGWPFLSFMLVWLISLWVQVKVAPRFCGIRTVKGGERVFFPLDPES